MRSKFEYRVERNGKIIYECEDIQQATQAFEDELAEIRVHPSAHYRDVLELIEQVQVRKEIINGKEIKL